ncbi:RDD family protein [Streptomyces sp. NPDC051776]|uniref:RDD family protein n=1 Tax=Streptomyces sp. NPDC051776 TaxID=3155414 RepID=UPI003447F143
MSTDEPPPGSGGPPEEDPFRKRPQDGSGSGAGGGSPYDKAPPPPPGEGSQPPPGEGQGQWSAPPPPGAPGPYGQGPYGQAPYGGSPYGADPLAGMPPLANRGKRLVARIIDALIIYVPVGVIMYFVVGGYDPTDADDSGRQASVQGVALLAYLIYEGLMLTRFGQTVGKKLMNIRVAMLADGSIPKGSEGWVRACVYTVPEIVPCCGFIFWLINVLWCTWDQPYHQCLHDKAARTVVVEVQ